MKLNSTQVSYFILGAYFDTGRFHYLYFVITVSLYFLIIAANVLLIVIICMNRSLHEPMYMLLCSLFVNELYGSTGLFPFLLNQILSDVHTVSIPLCFLQIFCVYTYGIVEFLTLAVMSYDRYLAICHPLHYHSRMTFRKVVVLVAVVWLYAFFIMAVFCLTIPSQLCGNVIDKVYCDNHYIMKLACSDTTVNSIMGVVHMFTVILGMIIIIVYTYVRILRVCFSGSKETRQKAFSTCTPHLFSLFNFSFGVFFEIMQSRFDMKSLPNILRVFLSLYFLTCQPLFNPVLYGLKMSKIRNMVKDLLSG
ncbi:olfactory receptor 4B13-like [Pholidichthys leucotaenia]